MLPFAVVLVGLAIVLVVTFAVREPEPASVVPPTPTPTAVPSPSPRPSPSPTPGLVRQESGWTEAVVELPPSPTPTVPAPVERPTRAPRPTPRVSECVDFSWSPLQVFTPSAQVKIDIRIHNRCPYKVGPSNLVFAITGLRDGGVVQSVRGVPFETIWRGRSGDLSVGLPGSLDWYDEIEVVVLD